MAHLLDYTEAMQRNYKYRLRPLLLLAVPLPPYFTSPFSSSVFWRFVHMNDGSDGTLTGDKDFGLRDTLRGGRREVRRRQT